MSGPVIDLKNPFYCPKIPASVYMRTLRRKVQQQQQPSQLPTQRSSSLSFSRSLERSAHVDHSRAVETDLGSDWILGDYFSSSHGWFFSHGPGRRQVELLPPPYSPVESAQVHHPRVTYRHVHRKSPLVAVSPALDPLTLTTSSLKRKNQFSDLAAPPKYVRSVQSFHDSSFDLELKREALHFSQVTSSPLRIPPPSEATHSPFQRSSALVNEVALALPGIRLQERLRDLQRTSAQDVMNFLSENGYINERILNIFSTTDVKSIIFAPSLFDENGLNICPQGIYSIFGGVNCFRSLMELSFAGISIRDADIRYIHHLPNLSVVLLGDTSITNEAVFLLMPLKRSLTRLCLDSNPDINNDSVPAIILLINLLHLSLSGTSVDIVGLRRLAEVMNKDRRNMDVEIPLSCEDYVAHLSTRYLCMPKSPLITDPDACPQLSLTALKRNLEAHAACNPGIVATGSHQEMVLRLTDLLKMRRLDALVMGMLEEGATTVFQR